MIGYRRAQRSEMGVAAEREIDGGSEEEKWSTAVAEEEGDHWAYLNT